MLLPTYFIIDLLQSGKLPTTHLPQNGYYAYKIDRDGSSLTEHLNTELFSANNNNPFCLSIDVNDKLYASEHVLETLIESIIPLTFHYMYIKRATDTPCIVLETDGTDPERFIQSARKIFSSHGYNDIESIIYSSNKAPQAYRENISFRTDADITQLSVKYIDILKNSAHPVSSLLFQVADLDSLPAIIHALQEADNKLKKELPQFCNLLEEKNAIRAENQQLLLQKGILEEQLQSLNSYYLSNQSDNIYKRQVSQLLDFYKYEYEILPLWYKQFGHIVKVLMGKRTFKSLFKDNVKKYKK